MPFRLFFSPGGFCYIVLRPFAWRYFDFFVFRLFACRVSFLTLFVVYSPGVLRFTWNGEAIQMHLLLIVHRLNAILKNCGYLFLKDSSFKLLSFFFKLMRYMYECKHLQIAYFKRKTCSKQSKNNCSHIGYFGKKSMCTTASWSWWWRT